MSKNQLFANCVPETSIFFSEIRNEEKYQTLLVAQNMDFCTKEIMLPSMHFYLTGRKTGNVAKSSELSAERWQCQATLDQMAE